MTEHELNELHRLERLPLHAVTEEDHAVYERLKQKRLREVWESCQAEHADDV